MLSINNESEDEAHPAEHDNSVCSAIFKCVGQDDGVLKSPFKFCLQKTRVQKH